MIKTASKLGLAMLLFASAFAASAQSGRPLVRLVVPFNPGGGSDLFARVIAPGLSEALNQTVIVDTDQGRVALAGQSFNTTSEFAAAQLSWELERSGWPAPGSYPNWMAQLEALEPTRVLFAHDVAVWERRSTPPSRGRLGGEVAS